MDQGIGIEAHRTGRSNPHIILRENRTHLGHRCVRNHNLARADVEQRKQVVVLPPVPVEFVAYAQIDGELRADLKIVLGEEIVRPAVAVHFHGRECARCRGRDAQQEIGVRRSGEPVRETNVAEEVAAGAEVVVFSAQELGAELHAVASAEPAQLLLKLLRKIFEAGMPPVGLRERRDSDSGKADFQHAVDIGDVVRQSLDAQILDHLLSHQRPIARLVIVAESIAEIVEQVRSQRLGVRDVKGSRRADLPKRANGREVPLEATAVGAVPGDAAEQDECAPVLTDGPDGGRSSTVPT